MTSFLSLSAFLFLRCRRITQITDKQESLIRLLRLQVVQGQLNPHFIFNVLGSVQHAILTENPVEANRLLIRLSRLLRNFLDVTVQASLDDGFHTVQEISIRQELELIQDYIAFERIQMNEKFDFELDVDDDLDIDQTQVPPMLLQPILENAIKHGISYLEEKGIVSLSIRGDDDGLFICIRDNGVGREESKRRQEASLRPYRSHGSSLVHKKIALLNESGRGVSISELDLHPGLEVRLHIYH